MSFVCPQMPRVANVSHFDPAKDLIALHYDCAPDPDDFQSLAADRTLLEANFGTQWLDAHVLPVVGTFGLNTAYKWRSCDRVAQVVWGSASGFLRASEPAGVLPADGSVWSWHWDNSTPVSTGGGWRRAAGAVEHAEAQWAATISTGGQVYVKEGGQSDFTSEVVTRLEVRWAGAGRCVHVVQHSPWNEQQNSPGVSEHILAATDYLYPARGCEAQVRGCARGVVTDGNGPLASHVGPHNAAFVHAVLGSWMACGWQAAFDESARHEHYGGCWHGPTPDPQWQPQNCVDFSDTHELSYILGLGGDAHGDAPLDLERFRRAYVERRGELGEPGGPAPPPLECDVLSPAHLARQPLRVVAGPPPPPSLSPSLAVGPGYTTLTASDVLAAVLLVLALPCALALACACDLCSGCAQTLPV